MDPQSELAIVRRAFAKQILAAGRVGDPRIEAAFSHVRREDFLGAGPWQMMAFSSVYHPTPSSDPVYLYVDQVIGLIPERGVNNGQPSLHAMLISAAQIQSSEHVVHIGAGTGYYTAIMAHLVGPSGRVTAIEYDEVLAGRARGCLASHPNITVVEGDGSIVPFGTADVIYVNAGMTHPANSWLDGLSDGGRLILPLTTDENFPSAGAASFDPMKAMRSGVFFRIRRRGAQFEARGLVPTAIIPAVSARDQASEAALVTALGKGGWNTVTRLLRGETVSEQQCWLRGDGWCLARD